MLREATPLPGGLPRGSVAPGTAAPGCSSSGAILATQPLCQPSSVLSPPDIPARSVTAWSLWLVVCTRSLWRSLGPDQRQCHRWGFVQPHRDAGSFPGSWRWHLLCWDTRCCHRLLAGVTSPTGWGEGRFRTNEFLCRGELPPSLCKYTA